MKSRTVIQRLATGFIVGSALTFACVLLASSGHGLYFPLAVVSAPGGAIGGIAGALVGAPAVWLVFAAVVGKPKGWVPIALHCCSIPIVFLLEPDFGDFERLDRVPPTVRAAALLTLLGYAAVLAWLLYFHFRMRRDIDL